MPCRAFLILAVTLVACSPRLPHPSQRSVVARSVLLITIDSLRADHVGAYGAADARTPTLDALANDGVRFDRAYATAPLTLPSHASLLTGRYPVYHGARYDGRRVDASLPTLADAFRRAGFSTAAFVGAYPLDVRFGLGKGFDTYDAPWPLPERPARRVCDAAVSWLEAHKDERFFLWVHVYDPHAPYGSPDDRARAARPAIDRYDDDVAEADGQVGRVLSALGRRRNETLIVVTSDHGEAFGEHGEFTHGLFVYDTTLRVPLIFDGPSIDHGRVVADAVSLVDVAPTVAAGAGLDRFESDGQNLAISSLRPLASAPRALYAESFAPLVEFGWSPLRELRRGDWKYISAPQPELYDLKNDPGETRNLVDDQPNRAAEFAREIERTAPLAASERTTDGAPRPDPKERREIAARMAEVVSGELRGPLLERALREIIRDDPGNGIANLRLAELLADSRRCKEAVKRLTLARAAQAPGAEGVILRTCSPQRP